MAPGRVPKQTTEGQRPKKKASNGSHEAASPDFHKGNRKRRASCWIVCFAFLFFFASVILGVIAMVGCLTTNTYMDKVYIADFHESETYDIHLRVGYFGGCVSVAADAASDDPLTHCVNMRNSDTKELLDEFKDDLEVAPGASDAVQATLNNVLPFAQKLQTDVFPIGVPITHLLLFFASGIALLSLLAASSQKRTYKLALLMAAVLGAVSVALAMSMAISVPKALDAVILYENAIQGSQQSAIGGSSSLMNSVLGLQGPQQSAIGGSSSQMNSVLGLLVTFAALFYIFTGIQLVRRQPEGSNIFHGNNLSFFKV